MSPRTCSTRSCAGCPSIAIASRSTPPPAIASDRDLASFINRLNAEGVTVYRRLSPPVLVAWMEQSSREAASYFASLDPLAPARFGVSWAGESVSANWFDIARELTERWHHQQQIRLALDEPETAPRPRPRTVHEPARDHDAGVVSPGARLLHARAAVSLSLDVRTYRDRLHLRCPVTAGATGISTVATLAPRHEPVGTVVATVTIPQDIAWRIFTKGIAREAARKRVRVTGDATLGNHVLTMLSIVG